MRTFLDIQRESLMQHLKRVTEGEVDCQKLSRQLYSTDASIYQIEPLAVFLPRTQHDLEVAVEVCREHQVAIVPRGGGTSLSGQAIGAGLIIDCSKHLRNILEIDPSTKLARAEPGVVLEQLNLAAAQHGLQFGPDVSTANRATIAGMIGNNSAGSRSIQYGLMIDHVEELQVIFSDAHSTRLKREKLEDVLSTKLGSTRYQELVQVIQQILQEHHQLIRERYPNILRRVSGYNLDRMLQSWEKGYLHLSELIAGSEGTLALIQQATVKLVEKPRYRGLLIPHFSSIEAALESLEVCLSISPSAVELMDQMILRLARQNLELQRQMSLIEGTPEALYLVEVSGNDLADLGSRLDQLERQLRKRAGVTTIHRTLDDLQREPLWRLRESGLPLLMGLPGNRKPVTFVEDTAVSPEKLPAFISAFREIIKQHGTDGAIYGHASVGCLHIRPVLDLHQSEDVVTMRKISAAVTQLVMQYKGSLSGEHGDGIARSEWLPQIYGEELYQAFCRIKKVADPEGMMNPGKIVHAPPMDSHLRYRPTEKFPLSTVMDYSKHGGIIGHVELCSGTGVCRKTSGGTMCPSFRATLDEGDSTRGRANALRLAFQQSKPEEALSSPDVHEVLELCLSCKACKAECPSNVDMAKLKAEATQEYYRHHARPLSHRMQKYLPKVLKWGSFCAPVSNALSRWSLTRWCLQKTLGLHPKRSLPHFQRENFRKWFRKHNQHKSEPSRTSFLFLDDCFTTYLEPHVGKATCKLFQTLGFSMELADICCGRALISQGYLDEARKLVELQAPALAARIREKKSILGAEPSCLLTLRDEWPELVPGPETKLISEHAVLMENWLVAHSVSYRPLKTSALFHGHCHQKALVGTDGTLEALAQIPQLQVKVLDAGCCGMAGFFGYMTQHYDLSQKIANLSLIPAITESPDAIVLAAGTSCRHQIRDFSNATPMHPLELLAQQCD